MRTLIFIVLVFGVVIALKIAIDTQKEVKAIETKTPSIAPTVDTATVQTGFISQQLTNVEDILSSIL